MDHEEELQYHKDLLGASEAKNRKLTEELAAIKAKVEAEEKSTYAEWALDNALPATIFIFSLILGLVWALIKYKSGFAKIPNWAIIVFVGFIPAFVWVWFVLDYGGKVKAKLKVLNDKSTPASTTP